MTDKLDADQQNAIERAVEVSAHARRIFGNEAQDWMLVEECGELLTALARRERGRGTESEVDEEVADVLLVALGALNPEVWRALSAKVERLACRIEEYRIEHAEVLL